MKKENKQLLDLLSILAIINLVLVFAVGVFCKVMAGVYPHIFGDHRPPQSEVALVFHTYWWPWIPFTASCLCIIAIFLGTKAKTLVVSAVAIFLTDIFCMAITLFIIAALFERPLWKLI
jgi:hypothetical protein